MAGFVCSSLLGSQTTFSLSRLRTDINLTYFLDRPDIASRSTSCRIAQPLIRLRPIPALMLAVTSKSFVSGMHGAGEAIHGTANQAVDSASQDGAGEWEDRDIARGVLEAVEREGVKLNQRHGVDESTGADRVCGRKIIGGRVVGELLGGWELFCEPE
jgi:hypothetical protein